MVTAAHFSPTTQRQMILGAMTSTSPKKSSRPEPGSIGERIQTLRLTRGETQADLAKAIDIRQSTISKLELNRISPKAVVLSRIAHHYKVDPAFLSDGMGAVSEHIKDSKEILQQLQMLRQLKEDINLSEQEVEMLKAKILTSVVPNNRGKA